MIRLFLMAFVLTCQIAIGSHLFDQVHEVEINSSGKTLGDNAKIQLPHFKGLDLEKEIKPGDKVSINLGYLGKYQGNEFTGYVAQVKPNYPVEILCEDGVYHLKRTDISTTYRNTTLKGIIRDIVDKTNAAYPNALIQLHPKIPHVQIEKLMVSDNAASALKKLKEYGMVSYFRGNQLYVGLKGLDMLGAVNYSLEYNVIKHDLSFVRAEDRKIKIKAIRWFKDNTKQEIEVGDLEEGELKTFHTHAEDLEKFAQDKLESFKYDGFEGDFLTFLIPYATHGMTADINDPQFPERTGRYVIDEVTTTFGINGARRKLKPGRKVSVS
jgi:hypothetical protein